MISTTRTLTVASERARSFARLLIWLLFTPAAGFSSKRVTTGPGMHGDDLGLDAEIVELELDEPRHRFQRLGRVAALFRRRIVEQRQRRQLARLRRLEHRHLALALESLARARAHFDLLDDGLDARRSGLRLRADLAHDLVALLLRAAAFPPDARVAEPCLQRSDAADTRRGRCDP